MVCRCVFPQQVLACDMSVSVSTDIACFTCFYPSHPSHSTSPSV